MTKQLKPHLACDWDRTKLKYPVILMPKVDGVRALSLFGAVTGRSLKAFKNNFVTNRFSGGHTLGFDGELADGDPTAQDLCRKTSGLVGRKKDKPGKPKESQALDWWVFDFLAPHIIDLPYKDRLYHLGQAVYALQISGNTTIKTMPWTIAYNEADVLAFEEKCLNEGYEGVIGRDPEGLHKSGRATTKVGAYWRIKRFVDFEGEILELLEAMENTNEAKTNELGRTERSSHQENKVPKGMVGTIRKRVLKDVEYLGESVLKENDIVDVGPGELDHKQRKEMWDNRAEFVGQIGKSKFFPKGMKDKPRFGTFISVRAEEDMSE